MAVLIILAIFAAIAQYYRETIAREFVNSALSERGITATELSIQTLATDYVRLSYLVLEQDDGTRFEISGLSLPLTLSSLKPERISIEQLVLVPATTETAAPSLARLLDELLQLPGIRPNTEISIAHFTAPVAPSVDNIVWKSTDQQQELAFSVLSVDVSIEIDRVNDSQHQVQVNAVVGDVRGAFSSTLSVHRIDTGFSIVGMSTIDLSPWLPLLQSVGLLSDDVVSINARLDGQVRMELTDDETNPVPASAHFLLADQITADISIADDSDIRLQVEISDPIQLDFEYPSLDWAASIGQINMNVDIEPVGNVTVQLTDLECSSGVRCVARVSLDAGALEFESLAIGGATMSATLTVADDETTRVDVSSDFAMEISGIESQAFSVASVSATQISGSNLIIDADGWYGGFDRIELVLKELSDGNSMIASLPMAISDLRILDGGATVNADVFMLPKAATLSGPGGVIVMPGVRGAISIQNSEVTSSAELFDDEGTLSAFVNASYELTSGDGSISIDNAVLHFDRSKLSEHFLVWPYALDIVSGTLRSKLAANWKTVDGSIEYDAAMTSSADALAGIYNDIVFSGLHTELTGSLDSVTGITLLPSTIMVALLDVGVPVKKLAANFLVNVVEQSVQVHAASMSVLGGQLVIDPFHFHSQRERNDIVLRPQSIQLQFMVDLAEFEAIELSGSLSGILPMTISENSITITDGRLESDPPGGVIRYLPGLNVEDDEGTVSDLGLVSRALANFEYDSLISDVNYTESGDLKLQMRLTGINPDMDATQPVILNLDLENNIPQLLRSLQATRSIEDILERRGIN